MGDVFKFPLPAKYRDRKYISQHFGANPEAYKQWGAGHAGTDIAVPQGTPVYSARTGNVVALRADADHPAKYLGLYVLVQSADDKRQNLYAHLSRVQVANGAHVNAGDKIGDSGNTGNTTGPHLHFGERPLPKQANGYRGFVNAEELLFGALPEDRSPGDSSPGTVPDKAGNVDAALGPGAAAPRRRRLPVHVPSVALGAPAWIVLAWIVLNALIRSGVNPGFDVASLRSLEGVIEAVAQVEGVDLPDVPLPTAPTSPETTSPATADECRASLPALDRFNIHVAIEGDVSGYGTQAGNVYCVMDVERSDANHDWYVLRQPVEALDVGYVRAMADNGVRSFEQLDGANGDP